MRILLVEDECITRESARLSLEDAGHTVTAVENGKRALQATQSSEYDVILMDIKMPVLDGIEAAKRIRQLPSPIRTVPIIAITAFDKFDLKNFDAAQFNGYIEKPYNRLDLLQQVESVPRAYCRKEPA